MRTKETIFNAALYRVGRTPNDQTGAWAAMDANYDEIVLGAFEEAGAALLFGKRRIELTSRFDGDFGYDDRFTYPSDVIAITDVFLDEVAADVSLEPWEASGETSAIYLNARGRTVEIEYIAKGQEASWSASFALGVQRSLEAVIKGVLEEPEEEAMKLQEADAAFLKAGIHSSKQRSRSRLFKRGSGRILRARGRPYDGGYS